MGPQLDGGGKHVIKDEYLKRINEFLGLYKYIKNNRICAMTFFNRFFCTNLNPQKGEISTETNCRMLHKVRTLYCGEMTRIPTYAVHSFGYYKKVELNIVVTEYGVKNTEKVLVLMLEIGIKQVFYLIVPAIRIPLV